MKKLFSSAAITAAVALSALAVASGIDKPKQMPRTRQEIAAHRASRAHEVKPVNRFKKAPITSGNDLELHGMLYEVYDSPFYGYRGPMVIDSDAAHRKLSDNYMSVYSGCYMEGKFCAFDVDWNSGLIKMDVYDEPTWKSEANATYTVTSPNLLPADLTYDPTTKTVYGAFFTDAQNIYGGDEWTFCYVDFNDAFDLVKVVGNLPVFIRGVAATPEGTIYCLGLDGFLYTINKHTAELTPVGEVALYSAEDDALDTVYVGNESMEYDYSSGKLYLSYGDGYGDTYLAVIDPVTCEATTLGDYSDLTGSATGEIFSAIYFKQGASKAEGTPAMVDNLTAAPVETEMKANISFDMPATDTNGEQLSGDLTYTITDGNNPILSNSAAPGEHVSVEVSTETEGFNTFVVIVTMNGNESPSASTRAFIGCDTPVIEGIPNVIVDGLNATVIWRKAFPLNNGNMEPVTYKVVRQPGDVVIADATAETSVADAIDSDYKTGYTYEITPMSGSKTGATVTSRLTYIGSLLSLPYTDAFDNEAIFNQYQVIDANNDNNTWWIDTNRKTAVYSASSTNNGDDYLLIGPFDMAADVLYTFDMTAGGHNRIEKVNVLVGNNPEDAGSFNTEIIPVTELNPYVGDADLKGEFTPTESGRYYFGIHACSDANATNLYIYNVKVSGLTGKVPAAATVEFNAIADGGVLSIVLPSTTLNGAEPASLTSVKIYRDGELLDELTEGIADGASITYTDRKEATTGRHTYSVVAVNADGEGQETVVNAYLGPDIPGAPTNMRVYEDINTPGLIHVTWSAPTKGVNGGYYDPSTVSYAIDWLSYNSAGAGQTTVGNVTSFDFNLPADALLTQDIIAFTVKAMNAQGTGGSQSSQTMSTYTGPALTLPLYESWAGSRQTSGIWSGESVKEDEEIFETWWDCTNESNTTFGSQDEDGYMMGLSTTKAGGAYRLRTPRITVAGLNEPTLVIHCLYTRYAESFTIEVAVDDQPMKPFKEIQLNPRNEEKWMRLELPLSEFKSNKYLQFGITGHSKVAAGNFIAIDNVSMLDYIPNDMMVTSFTAPVKVNANDEAVFTAVIRNTGALEQIGEEYKVNLVKNGKVVKSVDGVDIEAHTNKTFTITDTPTPADPAESTYQVVVELASDTNPSNNSSAVETVTIAVAEHPVVTGLNGTSGNGVNLTWNSPDMSTVKGNSVTETFDTYDPFITSGFGDWTVYDGDGRPTVIMATALGVLNYPNIGQPMAWQVIDPAAANIIQGAWYARSGANMLVSFQACFDGNRDVASNDWLISPELSGEAQTISFYARAGMGGSYAPELIDIMYSTGDNEVASFQTLAADVVVPYSTTDWKEYTFKLPAGTRYFAIVHKSFEKLALLLDDVTYIPAGAAPVELNLIGYHVYRDGVRITDTPVAATSFNDSEAVDGQTYTYHVTAVYDKGESALCEPVSVMASSGISNIGGGNVSISVDGRDIVITGADSMQADICTPAGMTVATASCAAQTRITLPAAGLYIVRVGRKVAKVVVR